MEIKRYVYHAFKTTCTFFCTSNSEVSLDTESGTLDISGGNGEFFFFRKLDTGKENMTALNNYIETFHH